jgi:hypothetical protein
MFKLKHSREAGRALSLFLVGAAALCTTGCTDYGSVEQGRVIAFNKKTGQVTMIRDSTGGAKPQAAYNGLPPILVKSPADPDEMGPDPQAGRLMDVDLKNHVVTIYDSTANQMRTLSYTPLEEKHNVAKGTGLPLVDKEKRKISVYWREAHTVVTFPATDEMLAMPADAWKAGDIVRYYFKDPAQALRMMNVTRTDLTKS